MTRTKRTPEFLRHNLAVSSISTVWSCQSVKRIEPLPPQLKISWIVFAKKFGVSWLWYVSMLLLGNGATGRISVDTLTLWRIRREHRAIWWQRQLGCALPELIESVLLTNERKTLIYCWWLRQLKYVLQQPPPPPHRALPSVATFATDVSDTASYSGRPGAMSSDMRDAPCINNKKSDEITGMFSLHHTAVSILVILRNAIQSLCMKDSDAHAEKIVRHKTMNYE